MQLNVQNFKLLHNHLMSILTTNNFEHQHLPQKIMQYIGMIVQSQKNPTLNQDLFDFFCEYDGNKIMKLTLEVDPMLSVKILSMLFINLTSHYWISYLLCQPYIIDAIQYEDIPNQQQWPQYYISLLKSLSIRLNEQQMSLFYNKKFCKFPLLYESLKYYNHPDCMVRTNIMNIILGIMKIKDQRLIKYFGRFPFTSYILTYCCQIKARIQSVNKHLLQISQMGVQNYKNVQSNHRGITKSYYIDLVDYICYLNDLMELGSMHLGYFVENCMLVYIVLPVLKYINQKSLPLLTSNAILVIFTIFKNTSNQKFKEILCLLLTGRQLPSFVVQKLKENAQQHSQIYIPKVYSQEFQPGKYYWNSFSYQIDKQCLKLFEDVKDFQTQHEIIEQNVQLTKQFMEEINKISNCLGFNILNYSQFQNQVSLAQLANVLNLSAHHNDKHYLSVKFDKQALGQKIKLQANPIRQSLYKILHRSINVYQQDSLIQSISTLLNNFTTCQTINNNILQFCGILLPRLDTINYVEEQNIKQMDVLTQMGVQFVRKVNEGTQICQKQKLKNQEKQNIKVDLPIFSINNIKNMIILLFQSLYKPLPAQCQKIIIQFYRNSLIQFKNLVTKRNIKIIVQNFQIQYFKWNKQAFFHGINLNQQILSPRKSIKEIVSDNESQRDSGHLSKLYFNDNKQKVLYYMQKFILVQALIIKYRQNFINKLQSSDKVIQQRQNSLIFKNLYLQKYSLLHQQKYTRIQQKFKLNHSYQIGFKHIVECFSHEKKSKNAKRLIIVEDNYCFVLVEPSKQENKAKIIVNHPWKYVIAEIDRQTGRKMSLKFSQCFRGQNKIQIFFQDQIRNAGTLQWMNSLKYERYQSEQAFILSYVKQCLGKL